MDLFDIAVASKLAGGGGGGGGGGEGLTLLASEEVTIETASSSAVVVKEIPVNESDYLGTKLLLVLIYDKAGFSAGHFYSTINLIEYPTIQDKPVVNYGVYLNASRYYTGWASTGGVYISSVTRSSGVSTLKISSKQSSSTGTVTGSTYAIKVYAVDVPSNFVFPS